jgi:hypothetical protein
MIKRGDRAKGFRFENSSGVRWNYQMENFVGLEGIVRQVRPKTNELIIGFIGTTIYIDTLRVMPVNLHVYVSMCPMCIVFKRSFFIT